MNFLRSTLSASLLLLISNALTFSAQAADPSSGGSLGIRVAQIPSAVADKPFSDVYIISRLQPATNFMQRLEVFNTSTEEFQVQLYPGAASFTDGKFNVFDGRSINTLTSWTKLSTSLLTLGPGESQTFIMTIATPNDALSVQQFGVIWAEVQGKSNASGVTSVSRVGIRMYVPVGNASAITIPEVGLAPSDIQISAKASKVKRFLVHFLSIFLVLSVLFLILFLIYFRRNSSENKDKKRFDRYDKAEWLREKKRRAEISKRVMP